MRELEFGGWEGGGSGGEGACWRWREERRPVGGGEKLCTVWQTRTRRQMIDRVIMF